MESRSVSPVVAGKVLKGPRACATCAKAKSRCIAGPRGQEKCERCHRLRKPCSSQTPAPARKRKEPKPTRVAELERRLEDLSARMESVQRQVPEPSPSNSDHYGLPSISVGAPADPDDPLPPRNLSGTQVPIPTFGRDRWTSPFGHIFPERSIFDAQPEHHQPAARAVSPSAPSGLTPALTTTSGSLTSSPYQQPYPQPLPQQSYSDPWPQGEEAESLLGLYREKMCHLFPFAIVPPHLTSAQMREERPFFWKVVVLEACLFDGRRQAAMGDELLRDLTEAAFVRAQNSIDLLQGLLMFIGWYHNSLTSVQMTRLLFLARSINTNLATAETKGVPGKEGYSSETLERMRVFVGTYYMVTITFTTNKRPDALMNNVNTPYLATCCRALLGQMEYPTDELVVHLCRAQQLSQSITLAFDRRKAVPSHNRIPQTAFIQGLQERVRGFVAALPPHIKTNRSLEGHLLVAEVMIYENSVFELCHHNHHPHQRPLFPHQPGEPVVSGPTAPTLSPQMGGGGSGGGGDAERLRILWECIRLVDAFMTKRYNREIDDYPRYVCLTSFDLTYVFLTMLKLSTMQVPGLDLARVREELHIHEHMSQLMNRMEYMAVKRKRARGGQAVGGGVPVSEEFDNYGRLAQKIRNVMDLLNTSEVDSEYAASQVARVYDPAPMTLSDAAVELLEDFGWQGNDAGDPGWDSFMGDAGVVDWTTIFNNAMTESSLYTT
ncbi:hypothetical protein F5144DRAFT_187219 [Chaetomium tenue]|uniref:Uncharacterized protein n=1 Tax=Chaetomium tenue TaxID=1854479 RepID=A0ACB7PC01_9PEZI|nr:hypothetical protein F5144DRAFT_187219 [Chaetomium globosum]